MGGNGWGGGSARATERGGRERCRTGIIKGDGYFVVKSERPQRCHDLSSPRCWPGGWEGAYRCRAITAGMRATPGRPAVGQSGEGHPADRTSRKNRLSENSLNKDLSVYPSQRDLLDNLSELIHMFL